MPLPTHLWPEGGDRASGWGKPGASEDVPPENGGGRPLISVASGFRWWVYKYVFAAVLHVCVTCTARLAAHRRTVGGHGSPQRHTPARRVPSRRVRHLLRRRAPGAPRWHAGAQQRFAVATSNACGVGINPARDSGAESRRRTRDDRRRDNDSATDSVQRSPAEQQLPAASRVDYGRGHSSSS